MAASSRVAWKTPGRSDNDLGLCLVDLFAFPQSSNADSCELRMLENFVARYSGSLAKLGFSNALL